MAAERLERKLGIPSMARAFRVGISLAGPPQYYRALRLWQLTL